MARKKPAKLPTPVFINAGCGAVDNSSVPAFFDKWKQIRVDVNPDFRPDVLAHLADLSAIPDGCADAIWSAHSMEHLFAHEVPMAFSEFRRVLCDTGFACIVVPDLQAIAEWLASDRLDQTIYESEAGPVTAHDMIWGFGKAVSEGNTAMAHRCGFTPTVFLRRLSQAGFAEILLRRRDNLELVALALPRPAKDAAQRNMLMSSLGF